MTTVWLYQVRGTFEVPIYPYSNRDPKSLKERRILFEEQGVPVILSSPVLNGFEERLTAALLPDEHPSFKREFVNRNKLLVREVKFLGKQYVQYAEFDKPQAFPGES